MKNKEKNVFDFYNLCTKLKTLIRTGWKDWNVKTDRLESVAEHIFGTQMLAIAMKSEYGYDVDLEKVVLMLAIHESEEILIGDLTLFEIERDEKQRIGHEAIQKIFSPLVSGEDYINLILEFDEQKSKESKFARFCDKLEADLQACIYDLNGAVKRSDIKKNKRYKESEDVRKLFDEGYSWGKMWLKFGQERYNYDKNFLAVSNYALSLKQNDFSENK